MAKSVAVDFPTQAGLATLLGASLLLIFVAAFCMYVLLVQMELQSTLKFAAAEAEMEAAAHEMALREHDDNDNDSNNNNGIIDHIRHPSKEYTATVEKAAQRQAAQEQEERVARILHLPWHRRAALAGIVILITFMVYLFLVVVRSQAQSDLLSWIGMITIWGMILHTTISDEFRRERLDRLAALFSCILVLAMALNLAAYANRQHAQGDLYQGKARIIGYDYNQYTQNDNQSSSSSSSSSSSTTILRTDLVVAWGGSWGCPNHPDQFCQAPLSGALCQVKNEDTTTADEDDNNSYDDGINRRLDDADYDTVNQILHQQAQIVQEQVQSGNQAFHENQQPAVSTSSTSNNTTATNNTASIEEDWKSKNQDLEQKNQELKLEHEQLEKQNQALQQELDRYKNYTENENEQLGDIVATFTFDDDMYDNSYWQNIAWDTVWGDYSCKDLFEYDVDGQTFDANTPPGTHDAWPFLNIYGDCNTCNAYIVDFYSTQYFLSILSFKQAALNYGVVAGLSLVVTAYLCYREWMYPINPAVAGSGMSPEKEIELLPTFVNAGALA